MSRVYFHAYDATERTAATTTYVDGVSLTFTPNASKQYVLFWSCLSQNASATEDANVRLYESSSSTVRVLQNWEAKEVTTPIDYRTMGGMYSFTAGGSPSSMTFKIQIAAEVTSTTKGKNFSIVALELGPEDVYAESLGRSTTTSATLGNKVTLNITPATTGDYLLIFTANTDGDFATGITEVQTYIDTVVTHTGSFFATNKDTANRVPFARIIKKTAWTNAAHDAEIRFGDANSVTTAGLSEARILALRVDDFPFTIYGSKQTTTNVTNSTYVDRITATGTTTVDDHLVLTAAETTHNSITVSTYLKSLVDGADKTEQFAEHSNVSDYFPFMEFYVETGLSAASHTWKIQDRAELGTANHYVRGTINVLQVEFVSTAEGTLSVSQAGDTLAGTGAVLIQGSRTGAQADNTLAGTAKLLIQGSRTGAQADNTLAGVAKLLVQGSRTGAQDANTIVATAQHYTGGTLSSTQAAQTVVGTAKLLVQGSRTGAQADNTLAGVAKLLVQGSRTGAQDANTIVATAQHYMGGTLSVSQAAQTLAGIAKLLIQGSRTGAQADQTLAGVAKLLAQGTLSATQSAQTGTGVANVPSQGTATVTQDAHTLAATATTPKTGTLSLAQADHTLIGTAKLFVQGSGTGVQDDHTLVAFANVPIAGTLASTQGDDTLFGEGEEGAALPRLVAFLNGPQGYIYEIDANGVTDVLIRFNGFITLPEYDTGGGPGDVVRYYKDPADETGALLAEDVDPAWTMDLHRAFGWMDLGVFHINDPPQFDEVEGTLSVAQTDDTLSGTASVLVQAALSATQADHTLAGSTSLLVQATLSGTQDAQTLTGTGGSASLSGTLSVTQDAQTLFAEADSIVTATATATQDANTLVGVGRLLAQAQATATQDANTISATATAPSTGTLAATQAGQTLAATARVLVAGTLTATQDADVLGGTAKLLVAGTLAANQAGDTLFGSSQQVSVGSLSATQASQTLAATATAPIHGALSAAQADQTLAGEGELNPIAIGTLAATQANQTLAALGTQRNDATLTALQDGNTVAGFAEVPIRGIFSAVQSGNVLSASANVLIGGFLDLTQAGNNLFALADATAATSPPRDSELDAVMHSMVITLDGVAHLVSTLDAVQGPMSTSLDGLAHRRSEFIGRKFTMADLDAIQRGPSISE